MLKRYILAIDLGGTNLKVALLDLGYKIRQKSVLNTRQFRSKTRLITAIKGAVEKMLKENRLSIRSLLGLGLGLPGPVDLKKGTVHFFPNIPGWKEVKIKAILEKSLKVKVYIDNDANLMALAESRLGAARNFDHAVCLTLGTGIGGGIIIEKNLYRGSVFAAAEIGHLPINLEGPSCSCGGWACLEAYVGNQRILGRAKKIFGPRISLEALTILAKKGNRRASALWEEAGRYLGVALSGVVNLLNPDVIVLGGGVANAGKILFSAVKKTIRKRAMPTAAKHVQVLRAKLGNDAGLIGAAILVKEGIKR